MKKLDKYDFLKSELLKAGSEKILTLQEREEWNQLSVEERREKLEKICNNPLDDFSIVYKWYFRYKWLHVFSNIGEKETLNLLEIGSGESDTIPQVMNQKYKGPMAKYHAANMNKQLTERLINKLKPLAIQYEIIEDDAANIKNHMDTASMDMIVFEHSGMMFCKQLLLKKMESIQLQRIGSWFCQK